MKKKISVFLIISILFLGFLSISEVKAGSEHNIFGWAWSDNIGWISFNNTSGGGSINYGVHIDPVTGNFSGYAWSENIGWISFNSGDLIGCPIGTCEAKLDLNTYEVFGWARALAAPEAGVNSGGWDGWIRLDGVTLDTTPPNPPYEFNNWAWGGGGAAKESAVVGWISFNDKDFDSLPGSVDYQVMTTLAIISPNEKPEIISGGINSEYECDEVPNGFVNFYWTYRDADGDDQDNYEIQIATNPNFEGENIVMDTGSVDQDLEVDPGESNSGGIGGGTYVRRNPGNSELKYSSSYYWRIKTQAINGDWSDWYPNSSGDPFNTPSHPKLNPSFTIQPTDPDVDEQVNFTDTSKCFSSTQGNLESSCQGTAAYKWDFDYTEPTMDEDSTGFNPTHVYSEADGYNVEDIIIVGLQVTDDAGMCSAGFAITLGISSLPLPGWKEIPPF